METTIKQFTKEEFQARLAEYVKVVEKIVWKNYESVDRKPKIEVEVGRRYAKVSVNGNGVHTFIDTTNGNILKAATYAAPQKNGVRGNIFSADLGESVIDWHGTKYLR